jgi:RNA polymerase sigma-70 factor (ECF subfamily)
LLSRLRRCTESGFERNPGFMLDEPGVITPGNALLSHIEVCGRIRSGDTSAEGELVSRFQSDLMAIARARAGREIAADLVQETFAAALPNLRRGLWRGDGPLGAYLAAILRRQIRRWRIHRSREAGRVALPDLPVNLEDPAECAERSQAIARVRWALGRLPVSHREVLIRHYLEGQSTEEIAMVLRIPRGTVLSRLHHARRKLSAALDRPVDHSLRTATVAPVPPDRASAA